MDINDKLELMIIEHEITEKLFIGDKFMVITSKHGEDIMLSLTGLRHDDYYKWDIDRCEERATSLIESVVLMEQSNL
tara:strand:+ start:1958 stop:2188 length:231 start_codon:yes stop_codon:yes gene_type:complete